MFMCIYIYICIQMYIYIYIYIYIDNHMHNVFRSKQCYGVSPQTTNLQTKNLPV